MRMDLLLLFYALIAVDLFMCGLMLYFLWRMGRTQKPQSQELTRERLEALIAESQEAANRFVEALAEGRRALKELSFSLQEKEARLEELCRRANALLAGGPEGREGKDAPDKGLILRLAGSGVPAAQIAAQTGLTEGEVNLIIDLARTGDRTR